jgi:hypothetical protein
MIRPIGAQVAFPTLGLTVIRFIGCQKGSGGFERASAITEAAANTFLFIHDSHIAVPGIWFQRICRTHLHTGGIDTLTALRDSQITWKGREGILHDLYSGER